jgi:excisionase family DNA binding protein
MVVQGTAETDPPVAGRRPGVRVVHGAGLMSVRQVAEALGVCTAIVYKLVSQGDIPHVRVSNAIRVHPADVSAYVERLAAPVS